MLCSWGWPWIPGTPASSQCWDCGRVPHTGFVRRWGWNPWLCLLGSYSTNQITYSSAPQHLFVYLFVHLFIYLMTRSCCVDLASPMWQSCFCLLSAGIPGVYQHIPLLPESTTVDKIKGSFSLFAVAAFGALTALEVRGQRIVQSSYRTRPPTWPSTQRELCTVLLQNVNKARDVRRLDCRCAVAPSEALKIKLEIS